MDSFKLEMIYFCHPSTLLLLSDAPVEIDAGLCIWKQEDAELKRAPDTQNAV